LSSVKSTNIEQCCQGVSALVKWPVVGLVRRTSNFFSALWSLYQLSFGLGIQFHNVVQVTLPSFLLGDGHARAPGQCPPGCSFRGIILPNELCCCVKEVQTSASSLHGSTRSMKLIALLRGTQSCNSLSVSNEYLRSFILRAIRNSVVI
jgi:hypothetical protein